VAYGDCNPHISDSGWGRGQQPAINVTWDDARRYVAWLSKISGKAYRLLTEAEYEYVARAGTTTVFPWGAQIGMSNANCYGCGSPWDNRQPAPVGSFAPNLFGIYDVAGNVREWVEDCFYDNYEGAPVDGSARTDADCKSRVVRSGSFSGRPANIGSAVRGRSTIVGRSGDLGFRVGRTLLAR
jgi:formylglycine-generating enzyme required for sulfatase activity